MCVPFQAFCVFVIGMEDIKLNQSTLVIKGMCVYFLRPSVIVFGLEDINLCMSFFLEMETPDICLPTGILHIEGSWPEHLVYLKLDIYSRDIPFWSKTLDVYSTVSLNIASLSSKRSGGGDGGRLRTTFYLFRLYLESCNNNVSCTRPLATHKPACTAWTSALHFPVHSISR